MGRTASTITNQIAILQQRGLELDIPISKIREVLLDIGYYRLGFYWHYFEANRSHTFLAGSKFSEALKLYYLDIDLKNIIVKYLNRIEVNFRTQLIYEISNKYNNQPIWFNDSRYVKRWFVRNLPNYYNNDFKRRNRAIKDHHNKYPRDRYAPAWKTLEFMSFGFNLKLFDAIIDGQAQEVISTKYGVRNVVKFIDHFKTIIFIRNICAHGGVLYDIKTPKGITSLPPFPIQGNDRHSLNGVFKLISHYIGQISTNRKADFLEEINSTLASDAHSTSINSIIGTKIGYTTVI